MKSCFSYPVVSGIIACIAMTLFLSCHPENRTPGKADTPGPADDAITEAYLQRYHKVLEHYASPEDSLKLQAALYLIRGLPYQFYYESRVLEQYDSICETHSQPSVTWLKNTLDSLQSLYGLDLTRYPDSTWVTDEYLIENIEYSFKAKELPWCQNLDFRQFCEDVLPYKSGNEKPEWWRKNLWEKFQWVLHRLPPGAGALEACKLINDSVEKSFTVNLEYNYPVDAGYFRALKVSKGTCYGGSLMVLYPLRALGIPSTFDYVPRWANRNGDHNWNALYDRETLITFNGPDRNPGVHKIEFIGVGRMFFRRPKVFRKTYAPQEESLARLTGLEASTPDLFETSRMKDVTAEYIPVSDIRIRAPRLKDPFVYLSTFDNANWKPVGWGKRTGKTVIFHNMARNVAYLPVRYQNGEYRVLGYPILLTSEGKVKIPEPSRNRKQTVRILAKYPEDASNRIFPGQLYELFYWDNQWISLGEQEAQDTLLEYHNAPVNALFWIRNLDEGVQERIFTYENGKQIWY